MDFAGGKAGLRFAPVILAGGSGTRFWPRSRRTRAKQVLALDGERTMIQQTLDRLLPLAAADDVWVITNTLLDETIAQQLPEVPRANILSEPVARNTAPACALAAFLLEPTAPDTVIGIFPSDHVVKDTARFGEVIRAGAALAASGDKIVVLGVPPTRAETGYG
jgi:mannose-1-phosphate guanylyltransferase